LTYSTQKSLEEHKEKIDDEVKAEVEKAIAEAKEINDEDDLETVKAKLEALTQASLKIGQAIYGQQGGDAGAEGGEEKKDDDNTVDADFKEKDEKETEKDEKEKDEKDEKK